jgi:hypothetical protein
MVQLFSSWPAASEKIMMEEDHHTEQLNWLKAVLKSCLNEGWLIGTFPSQ